MLVAGLPLFRWLLRWFFLLFFTICSLVVVVGILARRVIIVLLLKNRTLRCRLPTDWWQIVHRAPVGVEGKLPNDEAVEAGEEAVKCT